MDSGGTLKSSTGTAMLNSVIQVTGAQQISWHRCGQGIADDGASWRVMISNARPHSSEPEWRPGSCALLEEMLVGQLELE